MQRFARESRLAVAEFIKIDERPKRCSGRYPFSSQTHAAQKLSECSQSLSAHRVVGFFDLRIAKSTFPVGL